MIRILVVDDHPAVREGTKAILDTEPDIQVNCLDVPYTIEAFNEYDFTPYDLILMDLNLGDINGMELSKQILKSHTSCKIILFTGYDVEDYFEDAIRLGLHGAVSKTESKEKLLSIIHFVMSGEIVLPYSYFKDLIMQKQKKSEKSTIGENVFNEREKSILREVEKGFTNQEIADQLHLSKRTIEYSLTSIFNKLNVSSRTEAVLIAKAEGVIE
ncbi:response regulator transcription factor [Metabacillus malikii]|uniref:Two-component system competent response regulator ComA n=1 Tax=Metabacillus malikii TaxID=1504265 RepID=A0ABT9ZC03_9BACI|nr:response regulator transcription factor [Metabacillus malikii]MDQ0229778.1 two-component system competent response regulator ComA [Metabacillus malikii]